MKVCSKCKEVKPESEFSPRKNRKSGRQSDCKTCALKRDGFRRAADPQGTSLRGRNYRIKNLVKLEAKRLLRKYGISVEVFNAMLSNQQNACAICKEVFQKTPHVDHDHATGNVRGLLCGGCNTGIGRFKDSPSRLIAAAAYLQKDALTSGLK